MAKTTTIQVTEERARHLHALKLAWNKNTLDEVLEELIKPRLVDTVKLLDIKVEEEQCQN